MNKSDFIGILQEKVNLDEEKCKIINDVLNGHFIVGRKGKEEIITDLINRLNIDNNEADRIYNISMEIIGGEIKNKLKHPFKSID